VIIFSTVQKAAPRKTYRRTTARVRALTNTMSQAARVDFLSGIKSFKKKISEKTLSDAWLSGNYNSIYSLVPWSELPDELDQYRAHMARSMGEFSDLAPLPAQADKNLRFDLKNRRIQDYVDRRTGRLVTDISTDARKVIQQAVEKQLRESIPVPTMARLIKPMIGLYPQQATALINYQSTLESQGLPRTRIDKLVDQYHDRLLDYRAKMIAKTETQAVQNQGQQLVWQAAAAEGLIGQGSQKVWQVDGNPCPECTELDGESVGLHDQFSAGVDGPPLHPNCECILTIEISEA